MSLGMAKLEKGTVVCDLTVLGSPVTWFTPSACIKAG